MVIFEMLFWYANIAVTVLRVYRALRQRNCCNIAGKPFFINISAYELVGHKPVSFRLLESKHD